MRFLLLTILYIFSFSTTTLSQPGNEYVHPNNIENQPLKQFHQNYSTSAEEFTLEPPPFPSYGAVHRTSKIAGSVSCRGILGAYFEDPLNGNPAPPFEFPINSGINYIYIGALWVGGIVGNDTLVTVGNSYDYRFDTSSNVLYGEILQEFLPPNAFTDMKSVNLFEYDEGTMYHAHYVDTFSALDLQNLNPYFNLPTHKTLNLSVVQKSYSRNISPYKNIILLDFIITNIGSSTINNCYVGLIFETDAQSQDLGYYLNDDLTGSLRDISTVYIMDNDGDPSNNRFNSFSPVNGVGLRPIMIYPPVSDTNFNWWVDYDNINYGPRNKGTINDPFRDFGDGMLGTPSGDINKYYIMSHKEWDYDQLRTSTIPYSSSLWHQPDSQMAVDIADGFDSQFLLSVGPIDLMPDSSIRAVFALFGGEFIHINPTNKDNLLSKKYNEFYDNLFFDIFRDNADYTVEFAEEILDPLLPPAGLEAVTMNYDTVNLKWDCWVLPEVTEYNLYLKKIPDSLLLSASITKPGILFESINNSPLIYTTKQNSIQITGLEPGQLYLGTVAQKTLSGESQLSQPIVIGNNNLALEMEQIMPDIEYVFFNNDSTTIKLSWQATNNNDVKYYKIYKAADSIEAMNRYYPFIYEDTTSIPFPPKACYENQGKLYCYYEMRAYDSISATITEYNDQNAVEGAYYWITAVSPLGIESKYSSLIKTEKANKPAKDIIVIIGSTQDQQDYAYEDSIYNFYNTLLEEYNFDIYNWTDNNFSSENCPSGYCTDWKDILKYKLIIVEEYPSPKILSKDTEPVHKLLTRAVNAGCHLVYFGIPPGNKIINLSTYTHQIIYDKTSFETRYMNLDMTLLIPWFGIYDEMNTKDSLAGFNTAIPVKENLPLLEISYSNGFLKPLFKQIFDINECLPFTPGLLPGDNSEILYTYQSAYPNSSTLQGMACGVQNKHLASNIYTFSFHLWGMEPEGARKLIDYIMDDLFGNPDEQPQTLPDKIYLAQNYPNPFNATTKIKYELSQSAKVTLEIYNILGQSVTKIVNDKQQLPGFYFIEWNSTDKNGQQLASGIYFYRLQVDNETITKKMMLLK